MASRKVSAIHAEAKSPIIAWGDAQGHVTAYSIDQRAGGYKEQLRAQLPKQYITAIHVLDDGSNAILVGTRSGSLFYGVLGETGSDTVNEEADTVAASPRGRLKQSFALINVQLIGAIASLWADNNGRVFAVFSSGQCAVLAVDGVKDPQLICYGTDSTSRILDGSFAENSIHIIGLFNKNGAHLDENTSPSSEILTASTFVIVQERLLVAYDVTSFQPAPANSSEYAGGVGDIAVGTSVETRIIRHRVSHGEIVHAALCQIDRNDCLCGCNADAAASVQGDQVNRNHIMYISSTGSTGICSVLPLFRNGGSSPNAVTPSSVTDVLLPLEANYLRQKCSGESEKIALDLDGIRACTTSSGVHTYLGTNHGQLIRQATLVGENFAGLHCTSSGQRSNRTGLTLSIANITSKEQQLRTGREARVAKLAKKVEKRRTSMFTLSMKEAPTDLSEVYKMTRGSSASRSAISSFAEEDEESGSERDTNDPYGSHSEEYVKQKSADAMAAMKEARDALEQRGEKLSILANKSDNLSQDTQDFKNNSAVMRKQLEAKKKRWGLF